MVTDPIANMLTHIRNASAAHHPTTSVPASKVKVHLLEMLAKEGFIERFELVKGDRGKNTLKIFLQYSKSGEPVLRELKRISKPGRRLYVSKDEIPSSRGGLGISIISTSQGMYTDREARKLGLGGELMFSVF